MLKKYNFHIENTIHERTKAKMKGAVSKANIDVWVKKWFETADELKKEFEDEGLERSVEYITKLIEFNMKFSKISKRVEEENEVFQFASGWSARKESGIIKLPQMNNAKYLAFGRWVLRDRNGDVVDADRDAEEMFKRYAECSLFERRHLKAA